VSSKRLKLIQQLCELLFSMLVQALSLYLSSLTFIVMEVCPGEGGWRTDFHSPAAAQPHWGFPAAVKGCQPFYSMRQHCLEMLSEKRVLLLHAAQSKRS